MKTKNHSSLGFTLIEMLATVAILALLMSVVTANLTGNSQDRNIALAENNLVSDLHTLQTDSLSSSNTPISNRPACYWQMSLSLSSPNAYVEQAVDDTCLDAAETATSVNFPSNISLQKISVQRPDGSQICPNSVLIQFLVPYGRIVQTFSGTPCGGGAPVSQTQEANDITTMTLASANGQNTVNVIVNGIAGNISTP